MKRINGIFRELLGLFVEDGSFALSVLVWIGAVRLLLPRLGVVPAWEGVALFAGLAAILLESVWRRAGRLHQMAQASLKEDRR